MKRAIFLLSVSMMFALVSCAPTRYQGIMFEAKFAAPVENVEPKFTYHEAVTNSINLQMSPAEAVIGMAMSYIYDILDMNGDGNDEVIVLSETRGIMIYSVIDKNIIVTNMPTRTRLFNFIPTVKLQLRHTIPKDNLVSISEVLDMVKRDSASLRGLLRKIEYRDMNSNNQLDLLVYTKDTLRVYLNNNLKFDKNFSLFNYQKYVFSDISGNGILDVLGILDNEVKVAFIDKSFNKKEVKYPKDRKFFDAMHVPYVFEMEKGKPANIVLISTPLLGIGDIEVLTYHSGLDDFVTTAKTEKIPKNVEFIDITGNGFGDFYVCEGWTEVYINNGTHNFSKLDFRGALIDEEAFTIWHDFNNNGKADFISFNGAANLLKLGRGNDIYYNQGNNFTKVSMPGRLPLQFVERQVKDKKIKYIVPNYELIDLNNDGLMDLILWNNRTRTFYLNKGDHFVEFFSTSYNKDAQIADINGNGLIDYFDGKNLFLNDTQRMRRVNIPLPDDSKIYLVDLDRDGLTEIIVTGNYGFMLNLLKKPGLAIFKGVDEFSFEHLPDEYVPLKDLNINIVDVNKNGYRDIIDSEGNVIYENLSYKK